MTRLQEVTGEQVRQAPVKALRAIFAGVGQLLLVADRLRAEQAERDDSAAEGRGRAVSRQADDVAGTAAPVYPRGMAKSKSGGKSKGSAKSKGSDKGKKPGKAKGGGTSKPAGAPKPPKSPKGQKGQRKSRGAEAADQRRWRSLDSTGNVRLLTDEDLAPAAAKPAPAAAKPAPAPAKAAAAAKPVKPAKPAEPPAAALPVPGYDGLSLASLRARLRNLDASQVGQLLSYERANAAREDIITMFERRIARIS